MYCTQCGQNVVAGRKFCTNCGSPMRVDQYAPEYDLSEENDATHIENLSEKWDEAESEAEKKDGVFISDDADVSQIFIYAITVSPLVLLLISVFGMPGIIYFAYILCVIIGDYQNIKDTTNANMKGWAILGVFLPPVYLFMRAQNTNRDYKYAGISFCLLILYEILLRIL